MWRISSKRQKERAQFLCVLQSFCPSRLGCFISYFNVKINSLKPSNLTHNVTARLEVLRVDCKWKSSFLHWECLLFIRFSQLSWGTSLRYSRGLPCLRFERCRSTTLYLWCHNFYFFRVHRVQWNRNLHLLLKNTHGHTQTCWSHWYQSKVPLISWGFHNIRFSSSLSSDAAFNVVKSWYLEY